MKTKEITKLSVSMPKDIADKLREKSEDRLQSLSSLISYIAKEWLEEQDQQAS